MFVPFWIRITIISIVIFHGFHFSRFVDFINNDLISCLYRAWICFSWIFISISIWSEFAGFAPLNSVGSVDSSLRPPPVRAVCLNDWWHGIQLYYVYILIVLLWQFRGLVRELHSNIRELCVSVISNLYVHRLHNTTPKIENMCGEKKWCENIMNICQFRDLIWNSKPQINEFYFWHAPRFFSSNSHPRPASQTTDPALAIT